MNPTAPRDEQIAEALNRISVPDHAPGFWDELENRLSGAGSDAPIAVLTGRSAARGRWMQGRIALIAAAAAVAAVVVGVVALAASGDDPRQDLRVGPATSGSSPSTAPPTTDATGLGAQGSPEGVVLTWIDALGAGEIDRAVELVGPRTAAYYRALGASLPGVMTESQEGYGAWADAPDRAVTLVELGPIGDAEVTIVVIAGTWTGEGVDGYRTDAIPAVRAAGGRWFVEPAAFDPEVGGRLGLIEPAPAEGGAMGTDGMAPDGAVRVAAPGRGDFFFSLDGGEVAKVVGTREAGGAQATWDPPGTLASGTHLLVVAYVDGTTITALAVTVPVEG